MVDFAKIGNIFQGAASGLQGRGLEFQKMLAGQQQQQRDNERRAVLQDREDLVFQQKQDDRASEKDIARMKTMFTDAKTVQGMLGRDDLEGVNRIIKGRVKASENFQGVDFDSTIQAAKDAELALGGDQEALQRLTSNINNVVSEGMDKGILAVPKAEQFTLSPGQKRMDETGKVLASVAPLDTRKENQELKRQIEEVKLATQKASLAKTKLESDRILEKQAENKAALIAARDSQLTSINDIIDTTDRALAGDGLESAAGIGDMFFTASGSDAANFEATLETLKSQSFLQQVHKMRGLGALGQKEGEQLINSIGALSTGMSDKRLRGEITRIRGKMIDARGSIEKKFGLPSAGNTGGGVMKFDAQGNPA